MDPMLQSAASGSSRGATPSICKRYNTPVRSGRGGDSASSAQPLVECSFLPQFEPPITPVATVGDPHPGSPGGAPCLSVRSDQTPHAAWFRQAEKRVQEQLSTYSASVNFGEADQFENYPAGRTRSPVQHIGSLDLHVHDDFLHTASGASGIVSIVNQGSEVRELSRRWPTLEDVANSNTVLIAVVVCLLLNGLFIGLQTDMPDAACWSCWEDLLLLLFTSELALRIWVVGPSQYFRRNDNPDFTWNVFDFAVVAAGCVNFLVNWVLEHTDGDLGNRANDTLSFNTVRLLRVLRVLRIVRLVRFLKQLYLLAYGFLEGSLAVIWIALLVSVVLYICAVLLVRTYGQGEYDSESEREILGERFKTIPRTMYFLFELIVAPNLKAYRAAMFKNPPLIVFLVTFVILGSFGVNGIVVALINESILDKNQARQEADRLEREYKRNVLKNMARDLFDQLDVNKNRVVPRSEFQKHKRFIARLFEQAGANFQTNDLDQMMYVMDTDDTGIIERSEFLRGVLELCDQIRPMSIMELNYQVSKCTNKVEQCACKALDLAKNAEPLEAKVGLLEQHIVDMTPPPFAKWLPELAQRLRHCFPKEPEKAKMEGESFTHAPKWSLKSPLRRMPTPPSPTASPVSPTGRRSWWNRIRPSKEDVTSDAAVSKLGSAAQSSKAQPGVQQVLHDALKAHGKLLADTQTHMGELLLGESGELPESIEWSDEAITLAPALLKLQRANADLLQMLLGIDSASGTG